MATWVETIKLTDKKKLHNLSNYINQTVTLYGGEAIDVHKYELRTT